MNEGVPIRRVTPCSSQSLPIVLRIEGIEVIDDLLAQADDGPDVSP